MAAALCSCTATFFSGAENKTKRSVLRCLKRATVDTQFRRNGLRPLHQAPQAGRRRSCAASRSRTCGRRLAPSSSSSSASSTRQKPSKVTKLNPGGGNKHVDDLASMISPCEFLVWLSPDQVSLREGTHQMLVALPIGGQGPVHVERASRFLCYLRNFMPASQHALHAVFVLARLTP